MLASKEKKGSVEINLHQNEALINGHMLIKVVSNSSTLLENLVGVG